MFSSSCYYQPLQLIYLLSLLHYLAKGKRYFCKGSSKARCRCFGRDGCSGSSRASYGRCSSLRMFLSLSGTSCHHWILCFFSRGGTPVKPKFCSPLLLVYLLIIRCSLCYCSQVSMEYCCSSFCQGSTYYGL